MVTNSLIKQSRPVRVCFLNNDFGGKTGSGRFCLSLVRSLMETGSGVECRVLTRDSFPKSRLAVLRMLFHLRIIAARSFDIIHALDGWPYGFIAAACSLGLNKKVVITAVGTGAIKPLCHPLKKILLAWAYRRADKLVAVSSNTRREILKILPDLKIEVINHGVDFSKLQAPSSKLQEIEGLRPYILSVGALKKRKGYECSIKVFAEVSKKFPDLKYVIVGRGPEHENLKSQISNLKLQNRVVFFSVVEEGFLATLYHNAELFILLPQDVGKDIEGFGLVFLEAAACGLPVVSSSGTSAEDAVRDGQNGLLVPAGDYQAAAQALVKILSSKGLRQRFSLESRTLARSMSWRKAAMAYCDIYGSAG